MKNRKLYIRGISITTIHFIFFTIIFFACGCGKKADTTLEQIAYDESKDNPVVYIKENNDYVPYLVLTSDYNGNVLLLRKNLLSETRPYKEHGAGWSHFEYGSYYEESSIDEFLNTEFFNSLSECTRKSIVESTIEVTDKESYDKWNYKTHMICRKVFLLSSIELGVEGIDGYVTTAEGTPLKYFKKKDISAKRACLPDGTKHPYWTRTPNLWESSIVVTIGVESYGDGTADVDSGVRPAFCMDKETILKESSHVMEGTTVYIIE